MPFTEQHQLLALAGRYALLREQDIQRSGISSSTVSRAVKAGLLERINRGLYRLPDAPLDENLNLSEVAHRVPRAVIVLVSALQFHRIGTHQAHSVYLLIRNNAVAPRLDYPPIEVFKSGIEAAFSEGVETHRLNDIDVPITDPARTVVDCFKYRSRLGLDLCLEALKEVLRSREHNVKPAKLMEFAKLQRVTTVIRPYLESLI
jgi:predicted transcriptional regulator of viral defense system